MSFGKFFFITFPLFISANLFSQNTVKIKFTLFVNDIKITNPDKKFVVSIYKDFVNPIDSSHLQNSIFYSVQNISDTVNLVVQYKDCRLPLFEYYTIDEVQKVSEISIHIFTYSYILDPQRKKRKPLIFRNKKAMHFEAVEILNNGEIHHKISGLINDYIF